MAVGSLKLPSEFVGAALGFVCLMSHERRKEEKREEFFKFPIACNRIGVDTPAPFKFHILDKNSPLPLKVNIMLT